MEQAVHSVYRAQETLGVVRNNELSPYVSQGDVIAIKGVTQWEGPGIYLVENRVLRRLVGAPQDIEILGKVVGKYTCTKI